MINIFKHAQAHFFTELNGFTYFSQIQIQSNDQTVLFQTIQFSTSTAKMSTVLFQTIQISISTKLNDSKYCYISLTIRLNINLLFTLS